MIDSESALGFKLIKMAGANFAVCFLALSVLALGDAFLMSSLEQTPMDSR